MNNDPPFTSVPLLQDTVLNDGPTNVYVTDGGGVVGAGVGVAVGAGVGVAVGAGVGVAVGAGV
jgi:hypothetical protein